MSYLDWHVGMKVVCVKRGPWKVISGPDNQTPDPIYEGIYTIEEISANKRGVFLRLIGFHQSDWFHASNFRPVQTRKTDISIFTAMLTGSNSKVAA